MQRTAAIMRLAADTALALLVVALAYYAGMYGVPESRAKRRASREAAQAKLRATNNPRVMYFVEGADLCKCTCKEQDSAQD